MGRIKNFFTTNKLYKIIIIALALLALYFFGMYKDKQFDEILLYKAIPHLSLENSLRKEPLIGWQGRVVGFVKFDNIEDQPRGTYQYYVIEPLNEKDQNGNELFVIDDIIKLQYLPPKSIGKEVVVSEEDNVGVLLTDNAGNKYTIIKNSKEIILNDIAGDFSSLITSNDEYGDFMKAFNNYRNY